MIETVRNPLNVPSKLKVNQSLEMRACAPSLMKCAGPRPQSCPSVPAPGARMKSQVVPTFVPTAAILTSCDPLGKLKRCTASALGITLGVDAAREQDSIELMKSGILAFLLEVSRVRLRGSVITP